MNAKKKTSASSAKIDEEVKESQWLGKALRRQQTQNKLQELAEQRKKTEKTSKTADSEVHPAPGLNDQHRLTFFGRMKTLNPIMRWRKWANLSSMQTTV